MQKAIFVEKIMTVSQGRYTPGFQPNGDRWSHHTKNAVDFVGARGGVRDDVHAPYDCFVKYIDSSWGAVFIESDGFVEAPNGHKGYQWMALLHDNDVSDLYVGKLILQGNPFYNEGTAGMANVPTNVHLHVECGFGRCPDNWTNMHAAVHANIEDCLFVPEDVRIDNDGGFSWRKITGEYFRPPTPGGNTDPGDDTGEGGNTGGTTEEVSEDTMNHYRGILQTKESDLAHLNAVALPNAQRGRDDAVGLYENNRRQQTIAEAEVAKTESNANSLKTRVAVWLEELRSFVAALFGAARTRVLGSIETLRKRIAAKLEAIRKRLEEMQSPITGWFGSVGQAAEDLFGLHRKGALKAEEYDEKELPAPQYDGRALEALEYDVNAKTHLQ